MAETVVARKKTLLLTNRYYMFLWIGQSLSLVGDYFFSATMMLWIIDKLARGQDWLPLATGAVAISATLPSLVLGPIAGVFVDRWNRRRTMIWTDVARLALITLFLLSTLLVSNSALLLAGCFVSLLLVACGSQFFDPARVAVVADLVLPEQRTQAYGSLNQARYLAQILGPSLSAPLYVLLGPTWAIALNAGSFAISALAIFLIRLPTQATGDTPKKASFWQDFHAGIRFFAGNRVLVTLLISGMIFMFGGMAYNSLEYLYGAENLHIASQLLGIYVACYGLGVVIGLPITAALARRLSEVEVLWIFLIASGIVILALSRVTTLVPGMVCGLLLGFFSSSVFISVRPLTVLVTPNELLGRVVSVEVPLITVASVVGGALAGALASTVLVNFHATVAGLTFGPLDTIFVGIGIMMIGAGVFARLTLYNAVKAVRAKAKAAEVEADSPEQQKSV